MAKRLHILYDSDLLEAIASEFDLREPNKKALRTLIYTLNGDYDPNVMQIINLATGVGKTYLMAAFIEYLRCQGIGNVMVVTPGKTVQTKTVQNFTPGNSRYIDGARIPPDIVTPQDYSAWVTRTNSGEKLSFGREAPVLAFIFNIQQLIAPKKEEGDTHGKTEDAARRKPRRFDETAGELFEYLKKLDDLVVIADESHLYSTSAAAFHAALDELDPAASIGLTASVLPGDHVIERYPLYQAIQDKFVKAPVLAFRKTGYGDDAKSEEQQLRDALQLRKIKQAWYDAYARQNGKDHLNAVLFVVCADVSHATQITELLCGSEYFGNSLAVLQVDSEHDDDITQDRLNRLDEPDSKVLAVVSVNKLKEGWDVKNIAVVVTLRAMASEVLTQQTMGRGLRLPFGKYTGILQIDQLDIISHQSFEELLKAENILTQFGLEEAEPDTNDSKIRDAIQRASGGANEGAKTKEGEQTGTEGSSYITPPTQSGGTGEKTASYDPATSDHDSGSNVSFREIDGEDKTAEENLPEGIMIKRNPQFADVSYQFPRTKVELKEPPVDLSEITEKEIDEAAKRVTSAGDVLYRKEIVAALGKKLKVVDTESAEVESIRIDEQEASKVLAKLVANMQSVPSTKETLSYISNYLIPQFMKRVTFDNWTVKSLDSACAQLRQLISNYIRTLSRSIKEVPVIVPKTMNPPDHQMPFTAQVHEPINDAKLFVRNRVYSGWFKSLFKEESFDSYSGEYLLAKHLNLSPHIVWWHRLHSYDNAFIYYNARDRYFPDFVAMDDQGIHWIIEGKSQKGKDDDTVQAKRTAAEMLVRKLAADPVFVGQYWGYLIAYEDDIERADSWDDLKALAQPVNNKP